MTDQELAEIRARADVGVTGPWTYDSYTNPALITIPNAGMTIVLHADGSTVVPNAIDVMEFIAQSHNDVSQLLAEVERLRHRLVTIEGVANGKK